MATPKTTAAVIAVVALFLATIAAYLVYNYLSVKEQEAAKAKMEVQPIVVAATDIPFGSRLQAPQLKTASWPKSNLPAGFTTDTKAVEGRLAINSIPAGSPVVETSLAPVSGESGVLSYIIPQGHRAITVAVNEVVGVAGFVLPNSVVDVVATLTNPYISSAESRISKIVLQNVKVLAVGQILEEKEGKPVSVPTVTLDVSPEDAEKLALASESKVQLILKHLGDTTEVKTKGATVSSLLGGSGPPAPRMAAGVRRSAPRKAEAKPSTSDTSIYIEVIKGTARTKEMLK